jgi:Xaa-Pro aminopeptidase
MCGAFFRTALFISLFLQGGIGFANDNSYFAARREALMKRIEGGAVAVLEGAPQSRSYTAFRQDNNFYYLTGVETPNALLLIDGSKRQSILFLPARNREAEKWEGQGLYAGPEARSRTGMDEVMDVSQFGEELEKRKSSLRAIYVPFSPEETAATSRDRALQSESAQKIDPWDGRVGRAAAFERNLQARFGPSATIKDLSPILDEMRRVKDALEIERLRRAGHIGALGLKEAMRSARAGMYEHQIASLAEFIFQWHGAAGPAFFPIIGSGPNSCLLHYNENSRKIEPGDVVVMDFGPDYKNYASDITRTFPVSGKFTKDQASVYEVVLEAQKAALEQIRPGAMFSNLSEAVEKVLDRFGYAKYLTHGVSHYVGMSTHDVGKNRPFEPGVVITVEPGVYIQAKNLGVRIEDTVLVTRDGYEILSDDVPKEIPEIEKLMSAEGVADFLRD